MDDTAELLLHYSPSQQTIELIKQTPILLLVGPTGAGKDSLKDKLLETGAYHHIVSHTTRKPRINHGVLEQDGREYHFIDMVTAQAMLRDKAFVEAKYYSGNLYGTSVSEIQQANDEGKIATTDIEVQGVAEYKAFDRNVMAVFLLPPTFSVWQRRLRRRYGDVVDSVDHRNRLNTALAELEELLRTDYYLALVNDDLDQTVMTVRDFAEKHKNELEIDKSARNVAKKLADEIRSYLE